MENKSLFQKLLDKVNLNKIRSNSTVKKVVKGMCAVALSLSLMFTTACGNNNNNNNNENSSQTGNNNNQENPYKEYSQILQNVLTDNYYNWLIQEAEDDDKNNDYSYIHSNAYNAIPYGFLEDEGFDVEAIKNNNLKCETEAFILNEEPNSLYLTCRVENKASIDYYTHFVLKYQLTDQELKDLKLVYKNISQGYTACFQAPFFIQELSQVKDAVKLSEMNITKESEKEMEKHIETDNFRRLDLSMFGNMISVTYVKEKIEEDGFTPSFTFMVVGRVGGYGTNTMDAEKVSQLTITGNANSLININGDRVYQGPVPTAVLTRYKTQVNDSLKNAIFYTTQDMSLVNMLDERFSGSYGLNK